MRMSSASVALKAHSVVDGTSIWGQKLAKFKAKNILTEAELEEEYPRRLESVNPLAPRSVVLFNNVVGEFEPAPPPSPVIPLFHLETAALLKTSPEILECGETFDLNDLTGIVNVADPVEDEIFEEAEPAADGDHKVEEHPQESSAEHEEGAEEKDVNAVRAFYMAAKQQKERKIPNAFNFCEEGAQTNIPIMRSTGTSTTPPPRKVFNFGIGPSVIYDAYLADVAKKEANKGEASSFGIKQAAEKRSTNFLALQVNPYKMTERVVCQNIFDEVAFDFRYFEDPADEYRSGGRLLPLWRFFLPDRIIPVTDVEWSSTYHDLIAVSFGEFDFKAGSYGAVALFTLKNPLYPERIRYTNSAALCVTMHPTRQNVMAVGFHDGSIVIYDCMRLEQGPVYLTDSYNKHLTAVYSVKWRDVEALDLYSISTDGYVKNWELMPTSLEGRTVGTIIGPVTDVPPGPVGIKIHVRGSGFRLRFHPDHKDWYYIGTVGGLVTKYTIQQSVECLYKYTAHQLPVNCIAFNRFVPRIFLSCSADWTVKMWEEDRMYPLLLFDLEYAVTSIDWSPFTSTVFAAATANGQIHIFDLHIDRYKPIYQQNVVSKLHENRPTRLKFNDIFPILVVGDQRGNVLVLKLSPNLRIPAKASKKEPVEQDELERRKLERVLAFLKPKALIPPPDTPSLPA